MEIHPTEMSRGVNGYQEVIERLTSKIREGAQKSESLSSACICRVPRELRKMNGSAYTPQCIAIGPLHRNNPRLRPMEHVKMRYMNDLLCRMTQGMENQEAEQKKKMILQNCVAAMEKSIDDAKKCYAEEGTLDAEMMLVDGCFILEFLYKFYLRRIGYQQALKDPIFANGMTIQRVQHDLLLLENQIPFLVLERLFPLTLARIPDCHFSLTHYVFLLRTIAYSMAPAKGNSTNRESAKTSCWPRDCVLWVSGNKMNNSKPEKQVSIRINTNDYDHILHKLHDDLLPRYQTRTGLLRQVMPSASELVYAGVQFVPSTGNDLFKVEFTEPHGPFRWLHRARLEIPTLRIVPSTEPLLRNFIAFEQSMPERPEYFTSYAHLMEMLVQSDKDVQVLEKAGVVHNWSGTSKVVTDLFNNLCKGVEIGNFLFADTCNRATMYNQRSQAISDLNRQYSTPWKAIGLCVAIVYFFITIAQLVVAIIK